MTPLFSLCSRAGGNNWKKKGEYQTRKYAPQTRNKIERRVIGCLG